MKTRRPLRRQPRKKGQALVEFALALPVLLLILFGIIEFGRLLQAWLAVQNGARFGLRYAVTGVFDPTFCSEAATALGLVAADTYKGDPGGDCIVPDSWGADHGVNARALSNALVDWARLPSIWDNARAGAAGISFNESTSISGSYLDYLLSHDLVDLGDASLRGYFHVMVCSNRDVTGEGDPDFSRDGSTSPETCVDTALHPIVHMDDAGGPGNRVRVTVVYIHPMILPILSSIWPSVPLIAWREGIVEQFRVSRVQRPWQRDRYRAFFDPGSSQYQNPNHYAHACTHEYADGHIDAYGDPDFNRDAGADDQPYHYANAHKDANAYDHPYTHSIANPDDHADANDYPDSDDHTYAVQYAYPNADADSDEYSHHHGDCHPDSHPNPDADFHPDANGDRNSHSHRDCDDYPDADCDANANHHADANKDANPNRDTHPHSHAYFMPNAARIRRLPLKDRPFQNL